MGCSGSKSPREMVKDDESVVDFLSENPMFKGLSKPQVEQAASKFTVKSFKSGERIISQGEVSDALFCVALGAVTFLALGDDGQNRKIRTMGRHEFFGEFGLIHNTPRTVTVDAVTDCVLISLTRAKFEASKGEACMKYLQRWVAATASSIVASGLREIDIFQDVDEKQLNLIGRLFKCEVLPPGTEVAREGEVSDRFYILSRGMLVVTTKDELGLYVELTRLMPGATFGEQGLLKDRARNATVTTIEESVLFSLGREEFAYFIKSLPELGKTLESSVNERAMVSVVAEKIPVFKSMSKRKQHLLAEVCTMHKYPKSEIILKEGGMEPRKFFIITRGHVDVIIGNAKVRTMGPGSFFGEVALVSESPHSATVKVTDDEDAFMLECSQDDFKQLFVGEPAVLAEISLRVLGTRTTLEDFLRHHLGREYFTKHAEKEFAKENIEFWVACEKLESIMRRRVRKSVLGALNVSSDQVALTKKKMLEEQGLEIFKTFICPDAPKQVNLKSEVVADITKKVNEGKYDYRMFQEAKREVFNLMSKDSFSRFQSSDAYKELMKKIGVYEQKRPSEFVG